MTNALQTPARAPLAPSPLVSCLTVTQPGRERSLRLALNDFALQMYSARELVIVHDGGDEWHAACVSLGDELAKSCNRDIRVHALPSGKTLGELRNDSVALARGALVCQWDDDDRSHPDRLQMQVDTLMHENASACYLTQQLHRFVDSNELVVEDWSHDLYPRNVVQGSALVRLDAMPRYPSVRQGEDTALLHALIEASEPIARAEGQPWLYCYQFHGGNTFERAHHLAIANAKRLSPAAMMNVRHALSAALTEFDPPLQQGET